MTPLLDRFRAQARSRPTARALNELTYAALLHAVETETAALAARGIRPGDRVAVLALNHPRTITLLFACEALGAILVPLNWRLAGPELQWIVDDAAPSILFVDGTAPPVAQDGMQVLDIDAPRLPFPSGKGGSEGSTPVGPHPGNRAPQTLLLVYTSGTTGRPKGAMLSSAALLANAALSHDMHALTPADHVLTVLPLFHVGGLNIQTIPALLHGARVTLHPRFDPAAALHAIEHDRPTLSVLVPATLQALSAHPAWATTDLSALRAVTTGSTVVQPTAIAPFAARGIPVLQVYGSTETAPIAIYTRPGGTYAAGSTGHPGPGCAARVVEGITGEILLQGPQLFHGYWNNPEATAESLADGWFRTGDIGTRAPDNSWTVHDRLKNLIVSGGENVYPAEIERVLHELPAVAEAAVAGMPDGRWQEVPEAWVVLRSGAACTEHQVLAHLRTQLARFKLPRRVRFVDALPRNAMGKVRYALLKELV